MKYLILENIRSAHNVGSMFRTADAAGVTKVFLTGYTPTPIDRFGRPQPEIKKTSLGASQTMEWEHVTNLPQLISDLQKEGVTVVSVEQAQNSVSLNEFYAPEKVAYIMGNEVDGVSKATIEQSDLTLEIPMHGEKESLNVSVSAGIVLYRN